MNNNQRKTFSTEQRFGQQPSMAMEMDRQQPRTGPRTNAPQVTRRPQRQPTTDWQPSEDQIERDGRSVCVRNLDKRVDEDMLRRLFRTAGNVMNITLNRDKAGNSKGYAYIEYGSKESSLAAINQLNGKDMFEDGRPIIVEQKRVNEMGRGMRKNRYRNSQQAMLMKAITQIVRISSGRGGRGRGRGFRGGHRGGFQGQGDMGNQNFGQ